MNSSYKFDLVPEILNNNKVNFGSISGSLLTVKAIIKTQHYILWVMGNHLKGEKTTHAYRNSELLSFLVILENQRVPSGSTVILEEFILSWDFCEFFDQTKIWSK